ncbi:MAG: YihA family ribosome biogenesis GTP-binding protein [Gammaproteobacteria bacterium]|nr:MAG: YihA family ribosome biogenesis GTP-binding protein [Gammaproteobacteria bacterium]
MAANVKGTRFVAAESGAAPEARYRQIEFQITVVDSAHMPPDCGAEVAFGGRSNAGKSTALNALAGRRDLARTSKAPGRTRALNFFQLDDERRLVDLPGYGYAKAPRAEQARWVRAVEGYLRNRQSLRGLVVIMDIRHAFADSDRQLLGWCAEVGMAVHILLSKADKLGRGRQAQALAQARESLQEWDLIGDVQLFSGLRRQGVSELAQRLDDWLQASDLGPEAKKTPGF